MNKPLLPGYYWVFDYGRWKVAQLLDTDQDIWHIPGCEQIHNGTEFDHINTKEVKYEDYDDIHDQGPQ